MGPNTEELVERYVFWQDTVHATDPARQLTWRVHIVCILLRREVVLCRAEEREHSSRQRIRIPNEGRHTAQESAVQGAVDLEQSSVRWVWHPDHRDVTQEPRRKGSAPSVGWWVAGADDLDALERDPGPVAPEAALLDPLPHERKHSLRSIPVRRRQVDLVAEEDKAAARHTRHETRARGRCVLVHGMRF